MCLHADRQLLTLNSQLSLLQNSTDAIRLTGGETEGGPRPTLRRTHNLRGLVGWALAHLQSRSRIFGVSERPNRVKRRVLQEVQLLAISY